MYVFLQIVYCFVDFFNIGINERLSRVSIRDSNHRLSNNLGRSNLGLSNRRNNLGRSNLGLSIFLGLFKRMSRRYCCGSLGFKRMSRNYCLGLNRCNNLPH